MSTFYGACAMKAVEFQEGLQKFGQYASLLRELVIRDLKIKYRRSFLGYLWSLLNPILMMVVMSVIFSYMFRFDIPNYPLYLICGQTLWGFFSESTTNGMESVIANGSLIRKVYIPKYIFPISRVLSSFVTMSLSLVAILLVMLFTGVRLSFVMLLTPIPLALMLIFAMGVSMMISAFAVYFRDILHLYNVLIMAWMYCTAIFYPISALPPKVAGLIRFNPMFNYITFFRDLLLEGTLPSFWTWGACVVSSAAAFLLGAAVFRKLQRNFILYI